MLSQSPTPLLIKRLRIGASARPSRQLKLLKMSGGKPGAIDPRAEFFNCPVKRAFEWPRRYPLPTKDVFLRILQSLADVWIEVPPRAELDLLNSVSNQRRASGVRHSGG